MNIIIKGCVKSKIKRYRFECRECGCVFECESDEVILSQGNGNETDASCHCPTCGVNVYGKEIVYRDNSGFLPYYQVVGPAPIPRDITPSPTRKEYITVTCSATSDNE